MKRVPPKSVSSPDLKAEALKIETRKDSAVHVSLSSSSLVKQPGTARAPPLPSGKVPEDLIRRRITTDCYRLLVTHRNEELTGARIDALASGPMHRRAQWPGYRPARSGLSTPFVNKLSHQLEVFCDAKKSLYFGPLAALEPQSCDVLTTRYALNRRMPVGAAGGFYPGQAIFTEPVAFPKRRELSRDPAHH